MIRTLSENDRAAVAELLEATGNFNPAELAIAEELIGIVLSQPAQTDYLAFVSETGHDGASTVTGMLIIGPVPATTGSWHMYWIAVHPNAYGTGAAQALEQHAVDFVRQRGGYWILAETSSQPGYQRARAFYQKQGFQILVEIPDYYKPSDNLVLLGKRLDTAR